MSALQRDGPGPIDVAGSWTLRGVAAVLGCDPATVQRMSNRGVFQGCATVLDAVQAAWRDRSEAAAGRGGEAQEALTRQRTRQAEAEANLKELQYFREVGELLPAQETEQAIGAWAVAARCEFVSAFERMAALVASKNGVLIEQGEIDEIAEAALNAAADFPRLYAPRDMPGGLPEAMEGGNDDAR